MGRKIYPDLGDTINKTTFPVVIPDDWDHKLPGYYRKFPDRAPIHKMNLPHCISSATIAQMVVMANGGCQFYIKRRDDIALILQLLEQYVRDGTQFFADLPDERPEKQFWSSCSSAIRIIGAEKSRIERDQDNEAFGQSQQSMASKMQRLLDIGGI